MSLHISEVEARALAAFITRIRPDWDPPGVLAAITKARDLGPPAAIAGALCRLAENHELRTPALLAEPGAHWGGTTTATRKPPTMCPDHPTERAAFCELCDRMKAPPPAQYHAEMQRLYGERRKVSR